MLSSSTPSALRTGDGSGVLPEFRLKDVFIEATTLDREIRLLRKRIDPNSRKELTRIIEFCRERLPQVNRSTSNSAANRTEVAPRDYVKPTCGIPTSAGINPRPSFLRPPSVRASAAGDASTKFRPQI